MLPSLRESGLGFYWLQKLVSGLLSDLRPVPLCEYAIMHQGTTDAFGEASYGGLVVPASQDSHELGFIEADHVLERLLMESHTSHIIEPFLAAFRDRPLLFVDLGLADALSVT